jgi:hypothetical protein
LIILLRTLCRWLLRNLFSLLVIVLVLYFGNLLLQEWRASSAEVVAAGRSLTALQASNARLQQLAEEGSTGLDQRLQVLRGSPAAVIDARLAAIDSELAALRMARRGGAEKLRSLVTARQDEILADYGRDLRIGLFELERSSLGLISHGRRLDALRLQHAQAYAALAATFPPGTTPQCPVDPDSWRARLDAAVAMQESRLALCAQNKAAALAFSHQKALYEQLTRPASALDVTTRILQPVSEQLARASSVAGKRSIGIVLHGLVAWIPQALGILLLALLMPPAIKAFLYFIVAPIASRRPPIRLFPRAPVHAGMRAAAPLHVATEHVSSVSRAVVVAADQELLVHSDYLQSAGTGGNKSTQWLLNARFPLASLAAGMTLLTRIRPMAAETIVVSSINDPFSEVGVLELDEMGALVLQPHNLVGVLQMRDRPVRITSHWRLGSLTAWLTLQLRYLVFHGPGTLVVKGCRGVRVEHAGAGRLINQAATIGFSASLAYSTMRTETFTPYLLGRQELFNDRFTEGPGIYVYEEMPHFGKKAGITGRGLEGMMDSLLKIFGI